MFYMGLGVCWKWKLMAQKGKLVQSSIEDNISSLCIGAHFMDYFFFLKKIMFWTLIDKLKLSSVTLSTQNYFTPPWDCKFSNQHKCS